MPEELDSDRHLLSDQADWDAPAWAMEPTLLPSFAEWFEPSTAHSDALAAAGGFCLPGAVYGYQSSSV